MADYRTVKVSMWAQDEWFMDLSAEGKLLFLYMFTNAHASVAGIYKLPIRTMAFETGLNTERVQQLLSHFSAHNKVLYENGIVWVVKMREHQASNSPKVLSRIKADVDSLPDCQLKRIYCQKYGIDTVSIPYPELASETDTETDTDTEEMRDRPATQAPPNPFPSSDPEWGAAISKLEGAGIGGMNGTVLLELSALWPDLTNGKRAWLDDAIAVAIANGAKSPTYAIRVLASAIRDGKRPGQAPAPKRRTQDTGGNRLDRILGVDIHGNPVNNSQ